MNTNLPTAPPRDRRREPRRPVSGTVRLNMEDPLPRALELELKDISAAGFRAVHTHGALARGQDVLFHHPQGAGRARVVWNLVLPDRVETGFMVLGHEKFRTQKSRI